MTLEQIAVNFDDYPESLHRYLHEAKLYDSSCSQNATVIFIDKDNGYFLKISDVGKLGRESELTRYFNAKGLAANVVDYLSDMRHDYLLTEKVPGNDCTAMIYREQPKRLCDTLAECLFLLHSQDFVDCPFWDHTSEYLFRVEQNYLSGVFDTSFFTDIYGTMPRDRIYDIIQANKGALKTDTLLHGDYCLPNIILNHWQFSGFVDLNGGGVGDRHVDLYWGAWTLKYNLKTDQYRQRFFDAYGREKVHEEMLRIVAALEVFG